jgi:hypothetical protein
VEFAEMQTEVSRLLVSPGLIAGGRQELLGELSTQHVQIEHWSFHGATSMEEAVTRTPGDQGNPVSRDLIIMGLPSYC